MVKTFSPKTYNEVFYLGDWFRCGTPVVMDLSAFDDTEADVVRMVDFASGMVVGCGGAMEKIAPKLFLLLPADMVQGREQQVSPIPAN